MRPWVPRYDFAASLLRPWRLCCVLGRSKDAVRSRGTCEGSLTGVPYILCLWNKFLGRDWGLKITIFVVLFFFKVHTPHVKINLNLQNRTFFQTTIRKIWVGTPLQKVKQRILYLIYA